MSGTGCAPVPLGNRVDHPTNICKFPSLTASTAALSLGQLDGRQERSLQGAQIPLFSSFSRRKYLKKVLQYFLNIETCLGSRNISGQP